MKNKEKLRKLIYETRIEKKLSRDKVSELLKLKGISYAESSLQRYETGETEKIRVEQLKGIAEILGLDLMYVYNLAGLLDNNYNITNLNRRERVQWENVVNGANLFFNDENYDMETKEKLLIALQELFFDAKNKNKRKK